MRSAISPRLAMRIFSNIAGIRLISGRRGPVESARLPQRIGGAPEEGGRADGERLKGAGSADHEERLAVFDRLPVVDEDFLDDASLIRLDLVQELHRFDDAD